MKEKTAMAGSADMMVLQLLSKKDMYGYEIIDTLRQQSWHVFDMKAGTLYPLLHNMEEKGYVTVYEQVYEGRLRKYYHLTKAGSKVLREKAESWEIYRSAVDRIMQEAAYA